MFNRISTLLSNLKDNSLLGFAIKRKVYKALDRAIYAVGDIHGQADLLENLLIKIKSDAFGLVQRPILIFLGDYIDKGPKSYEVINILIDLKLKNTSSGEFSDILCLKGNHELALLNFISDVNFGNKWMDYGGNHTLNSYGISVPISRNNLEEWIKARNNFISLFPNEHLEFINNLKYYFIEGDYCFVHAGIMPNVPIERQDCLDLTSIREPFLSSNKLFKFKIIHGHTPNEEPIIKANRICIDTGAYATNVLTAIKIQDTDFSFLQARK